MSCRVLIGKKDVSNPLSGTLVRDYQFKSFSDVIYRLVLSISKDHAIIHITEDDPLFFYYLNPHLGITIRQEGHRFEINPRRPILELEFKQPILVHHNGQNFQDKILVFVWDPADELLSPATQ